MAETPQERRDVDAAIARLAASTWDVYDCGTPKNRDWFKLADRLTADGVALSAELTALRAEVERLRGAMGRLLSAAPYSLDCEAFHHSASDRHPFGTDVGHECKPQKRYLAALADAAAILTPEATK